MQILSDKFLVKQCVQDNSSNVIKTTEFDEKFCMAANLRVLESKHEAKLKRFVYDYELKKLEDKYTSESLGTELNAVKNSQEK